MAGLPVRNLILWGALAATLLAVIAIDEESEELLVDNAAEAVLPTRNVDRRVRTSDNRSNQSLPVDQLGKRTFKAEADDIFAVNSWQPAPSNVMKRVGEDGEDGEGGEAGNNPFTASKQPPAAAPVAPPLQITYLGRISHGGVTRVFLAHQDKNHATKVGERIDGLYRLDGIRDDAIELTYLPLGIKQKLLINEKTPGKT
ncbi:MAG: hypothetical protein RQ714_04710 [Nitrosomonas sp.]|nr:hypothetical protein [Nitrosomonas sp.]